MSNPRTLLDSSSDSSHVPGRRDPAHGGVAAWAPAGHSRQNSADLRWTPYVPKAHKAPSSIFQAQPDQPCLSQVLASPSKTRMFFLVTHRFEKEKKKALCGFYGLPVCVLSLTENLIESLAMLLRLEPLYSFNHYACCGRHRHYHPTARSNAWTATGGS